MSQTAVFSSVRFGRDETAPQPRRTASPTSVALENLRGIVILIVLAFHAALAYVSFAPPLSDFSSPPFTWRGFPILDDHRFFGFDLFCAWQDIYLMSLMFFLSGLFVWPSLMRKKNAVFLRDRLVRLGVPFLFGILIVMPLASYPSYSVTALDPSLAGYLDKLFALPFWPVGPLWFLWQLLALTMLAGFVNWVAPGAIPALGRWSAGAGTRVGRYFVCLVALSALAYVPLALAFTPWAWSNAGPFGIQLCRPLQYAVYFFAGIGIGVGGIDRGLVAADGPLARRWALWLAAALASLALWLGASALTFDRVASLGMQAAADFAFVIACACGCFFLIGVSLRFAAARSVVLGALGANAYGLYLLHYVFVVWLQFALLALPLFAVVKAPIVFAGTLLLTWTANATLSRIPLGARLIGSAPRPLAKLAS
jgi:surface polysaccharide O-acyltransferase-like enzyme